MRKTTCEKTTQKIINWAKSVQIETRPITPEIQREAEEQYSNITSLSGLVAYGRHRYTNYDALLNELRSRVNRARGDSRLFQRGYRILHARCTYMIEGAIRRNMREYLDQIGERQ